MKKRILSSLLVLLMVLSVIVPHDVQAATVELSKTKVYLLEGKSTKLKVSGTSKAVTWTSSNKKVATVTKGKVVAKTDGTSTITAKVGGKSYKCKVTVYNINKAKTGSYDWVVDLWNDYLVNIRDSIGSGNGIDAKLMSKLTASMKKESYYKNFYKLLNDDYSDLLDIWTEVIEELDYMYGVLKDGETELVYADDFGYKLFDFMDLAYSY